MYFWKWKPTRPPGVISGQATGASLVWFQRIDSLRKSFLSHGCICWCWCSSPMQILSVQFWHYPTLVLAAMQVGLFVLHVFIGLLTAGEWRPSTHHPHDTWLLALVYSDCPKTRRVYQLHLQTLRWPVSLWPDHNVTFTQTTHVGGLLHFHIWWWKCSWVVRSKDMEQIR